MEEKPCLCCTCGAAFTKYLDLVIHRCLRHGANKFQCDKCDASFKTNSSLRRHKRLHEEKEEKEKLKTHLCEVCGAAFAEIKALERHGITHNREKPFTCIECGAAFRKESCLHRHKSVHSGNTPFKCDVCGASYYDKRRLIAHSFTHTGKKPYSCEICGIGFLFKHSVNKHAIAHHGEPIANGALLGFGCKQKDDAESGSNEVDMSNDVELELHKGHRSNKCEQDCSLRTHTTQNTSSYDHSEFSEILPNKLVRACAELGFNEKLENIEKKPCGGNSHDEEPCPSDDKCFLKTTSQCDESCIGSEVTSSNDVKAEAKLQCNENHNTKQIDGEHGIQAKTIHASCNRTGCEEPVEQVCRFNSAASVSPSQPKTQNCELHCCSDVLQEKQLTCKLEECSRSFEHKRSLETHKKLNQRKTPRGLLKCSECNMTFKRILYLRMHSRIHTNGKPFTCIECGASFTTSNGLNSHGRIHAEIVNLEHNDDGPSLKKRVSRKRGAKLLVHCNDCGFTLSDKYCLRKHMLRKHDRTSSKQETGKTFQCNDSID